MSRIINNQDAVASRINALNIEGVALVVADDGSVIVRVTNVSDMPRIARVISDAGLDVETGDGTQTGCVWLNSEDGTEHGELSDFLN